MSTNITNLYLKTHQKEPRDNFFDTLGYAIKNEKITSVDRGRTESQWSTDEQSKLETTTTANSRRLKTDSTRH